MAEAKHLKSARGQQAFIKTETHVGCACHEPVLPKVIDFNPAKARRNLRVLVVVLVLNVLTMIAEVGIGLWSSSASLTADGWHMLGHTFALGLSAYVMRKLYFHRTKSDPKSLGSLQAFAQLERRAGLVNASILIVLGAFTVFDGARSFWHQEAQGFATAFAVAWVGLLVNVVGGWLLHRDHDRNSVAERGMVLHLFSDALMSFLALFALAAGAWGQIFWLDASVGVFGGLVILKWGASLFVQGWRAGAAP
jgi:cation diffusion facilitator family transporter